MIRTLLFAAFPLLVAAETPGPHLSVPVLGYIFDATGSSIRQVTGVPGAVTLDQAVAAGSALQAAWIDSDARVAVVVTKAGAAAAANWRETAKLTALDSSLGTLKAVAIGAAGDRAALTDGTAVEVWSGLLDQPAKTATYHPEGGVTAVAVRQDGAVAAAAGSGAVLLWTGGDPQTLAAGGAWSALAFAGNDLLGADGNQLVRIAAGGGRTVVGDLGASAAALAVSKDGARVAVALAEDLLVVSLAGGATPVTCGCSAQGLESLAGNLVVHLAGAAGEPQLLDADHAAPRVLTLGTSLGTNPGTTTGGGVAQ